MACSTCISQFPVLQVSEELHFECGLCSRQHKVPVDGMNTYPDNKTLIDLLNISPIKISSEELKPEANTIIRLKNGLDTVSSELNTRRLRLQSRHSELREFLRLECDKFSKELESRVIRFCTSLETCDNEALQRLVDEKKTIERCLRADSEDLCGERSKVNSTPKLKHSDSMNFSNFMENQDMLKKLEKLDESVKKFDAFSGVELNMSKSFIGSGEFF